MKSDTAGRESMRGEIASLREQLATRDARIAELESQRDGTRVAFDQYIARVGEMEEANREQELRIAKINRMLEEALSSALDWEHRAHEAEEALSKAGVALANVSGALCDSGVVVPAEEWRYGEAVRQITAERAEALENQRDATACIIGLNDVQAELEAKLSELRRLHSGCMAENGELRCQLTSLAKLARGLVEALPKCEHHDLPGDDTPECGSPATHKAPIFFYCDEHRKEYFGHGQLVTAAPLRALLTALDALDAAAGETSATTDPCGDRIAPRVGGNSGDLPLSQTDAKESGERTASCTRPSAPDSETVTAGETALSECEWFDDPDMFETPSDHVKPCPNKAAWISCTPIVGNRTCTEHKCRCAKPISRDAGRSGR